MALIVNTNVASLNAQRQLNNTTNEMSTAMERLSSGKRINTAADDAAGLAIASRMTSQVKGLSMAIRNANDGISLAQTAEGAMEEVASMLQRMRELAVQASNSINNDSDRASLDDEVQQLKAEIERVASTTKFNNKSILDGTFSSAIQIGDQVGQSMNIGIQSINIANIGETTTGPAEAATRAALSVGGVSTTATDYQGISFDVTVNGVTSTVTLPAATPSIATPASAASATVALSGSDRSTSTASGGQIGAISEQTVDVDTGTDDTKLKITLDGITAAAQTVDIDTYLDAIDGIDKTAVTGSQMVTALQAAIDANANFVDANALTVSLNSDGRINIAFTNGRAGTILLESDAEATNSAESEGLLEVLGGNQQGETSTTGSITIGSSARTLDLTATADLTKFGITVTDDATIAGTVAIAPDNTDPEDLFDDADGDGVVDAGEDEAYFDLAEHITFLGYDAAALTGAQLVAAMNRAFDNDHQGAFASITASLGSDGTITITNESGSGSDLVLTDGDDGGLFDALNAIVDDGTDSDSIEETGYDKVVLTGMQESSAPFGLAPITLAAETLDLSTAADRVFDISGSAANVSIDITDAIAALDYDSSAMTAAQLAEALEYAINADTTVDTGGDVTASADRNGVITLTFQAAAAFTIVNDEDNSETGLENLGLGDLAESSANVITIATGAVSNNALTVTVNGGQAADVTVATGTYNSMAELATAVQTAIDGSRNFVGDYAVAVSGTTNSDGEFGLQFANAAGNQVILSGSLLEDALQVRSTSNTGNVVVESSAVDGTFNDTIAYTATVTAASYNPQAGTVAQRIVDLSGTGETTFEINVNSVGAIDLDIADALSAAGVSTDSVTGQQLVDALNTTFAANATFQGNNAVTASLDSDGTLQLTVAGGDQSLTLDDTGTPTQSLIYAVTGLNGTATDSVTLTAGVNNGVVSVEASDASGEMFGESDITVTNASTDTLTIQVGTDQAVDIDLLSTTATFDDMASLVAAIQAKIDSTGNFVGDDALTVSVVTNSDGDKGFAIQHAGGESVKVTGTFTSGTLVDSTGDGSADTSFGSGTVFPAARPTTGGIDLSSDNQVQVAVTDSESGSVVSRTVTLASTDANVSFSDYASLLQSAANTAFSADGYSFTASTSGGQLTFALDQAGAKGISVSGTSITDAVGGAIVAAGTAEVVADDGNAFTSMDDVVAAINDDLSDATASFDAVSGQLTFSATAGTAGTGNTISVSGADLAAVQIAGTLAATGEAGTATAARIADISVTSTDNASGAIASIDNALEFVNAERSNLGAIQNRLQHTVNNLSNIVENTSASRSRIQDADFATEAANLAKAQVLQQAGTAMLAQANAQSQVVLSLLG